MNISEINSISKDSSVKKIFLDTPVKAFLQQSVGIIEANETWNKLVNGINLTGIGQTVCILDTGINYSHKDFGSCNISKLNLNGDNNYE